MYLQKISTPQKSAESKEHSFREHEKGENKMIIEKWERAPPMRFKI